VQHADFAASPTGSLVSTEMGQWAFVPNPLPPRTLDYTRLARPLSEAAEAIGELNGIGRSVRNPYLLISPLQRREVISSSSMEGTYTTVDDLLLAEAGGEGAATPDTREVLNYSRALTKGIESLATIPLSLRTLRDAHHTLLSDVGRGRGAAVRAGEFKQHQNFIGTHGKGIEDARFVPPPPKESLECLNDLERYWHRDDNGHEIDTLIDSALIHYQFETIHPFADGNGRVGRMLIILHLFMRNKLIRPLLYLSPVFEERKDEYIDRMYAVSRYGEWENWIVFFLNVVRDSARDTVTLADKILGLQTAYREYLQRHYRSNNLISVVDHLFEQPIVSIPTVQERLGVTYHAARKTVETLLAENILSEIPDKSNPRLFAARDIIALISGKPSNARSSA
jgi:Fic family protein